MDVIRASDVSEGKCAGSVSSPVRCRGTSGQIFKWLTAVDSLFITGSNGICYNILSSVYCHLQSSNCHHVSILCVNMQVSFSPYIVVIYEYV